MSQTWSARMITPEDDHDAPLLRTEFVLDADHGAVAAARWLVSAQGIFEAHLGARPVSDDVLSPGWSSYEWRIRYREYDVTEALRAASTPVVLGVALGNGWYRGRLTWNSLRRIYSDGVAGLAQLEITFADGHRQTVVTDESWTRRPVRGDRERHLRRRDASMPGWPPMPGCNPDSAARRLGALSGSSTSTPTSSLRTSGRRWSGTRRSHRRDLDVAGRSRRCSTSGRTSSAGCKFSVQGEAGTTITIKHAEVLEHDELGTRPLRSAKATDQLHPERRRRRVRADVHLPRLPLRPDRGLAGRNRRAPRGRRRTGGRGGLLRPPPDRRSSSAATTTSTSCTAMSSGASAATSSTCPTDCPQRDERLGWTGDLAVFAPTAAFLFDVNGFLNDWLVDLDLEQSHADGLVPVRHSGRAQVRAAPARLPGAGHGRDLERRGSLGAVGPVAGVRRPGRARGRIPGHGRPCAPARRRLLSDDRPVGHRLPVRRLAGPGRPAGPAVAMPRPTRAWSPLPASIAARRSLAEFARILGHDDDAAAFAGTGRPDQGSLRRALRDRRRPGAQRLPDRLRPGHRFGLLDEPQLSAAGDRLAELVGRTATGSPPGSPARRTSAMR